MTDLFRRGELLPEGRTNEEEAKLIRTGKPIQSFGSAFVKQPPMDAK
jgi:hypothetical protein